MDTTSSKECPIYDIKYPIVSTNRDIGDYLEHIEDFEHWLNTFFNHLEDAINNRYDSYSKEGEIFAYLRIPGIYQPMPLSVPKKNFLLSLESILQNYIELENYERCAEVSSLISKLENK